MDIKSEVLKYIDLAENTAKALLQMHLTDMSDQMLNESLELIKELKEMVSAVRDNSTVAAMKKAVEVEDYIYEWLKCALMTICTSRHVKQLKEAVDKAGEWGTLNKATEGMGIFGLRKNNDTAGATEEDIEKNVAYNEKNKIVARAKRTISGATLLQKSLSAAERLLQREKDIYKEVYNTDELEAEIDKNNARLEQMFEQFKVMGMRIKNGEVAPGSEEYKRIECFAAEVLEEKEKVKAANYRLEKEIEIMRKKSDGAYRRIEIIGSILHELKRYKNQPAVFAEAMDKLGAERLQQFIAGEMSQKELEEFKERLPALNPWLDIEYKDNQQDIRSIESLINRYLEEGSTLKGQKEDKRDKPDKNSDGE